MQDSWGSLILFLLVVLIVIFLILGLCCCTDLIEANTERRSEELIDEINLIERRLNTGIHYPNSNFTQRRNEANVPLEEIYAIEIAPNITDAKPPPYSEIMVNEMDLNEPPPSYLESFKVSKFQATLV